VVFDRDKSFQLCLVFAAKASLPASIRLGREDLYATSTLVFFVQSVNGIEKSFITLTLDIKVRSFYSSSEIKFYKIEDRLQFPRVE